MTTREALTQAARRKEKSIEAMQRMMEHAHSLTRLVQEEQADVITRARAGGLLDQMLLDVHSALEDEESQSATPDELMRPWDYVERALDIDGEAGPGGPFVDEVAGDYDAIPIGELAGRVNAIITAEQAAATAAR
jgi:hypothetical protein